MFDISAVMGNRASKWPGIGEIPCSKTLEKEHATVPSETQLREIFSALGEGLFVASPDGAYLDANPAACEMLGYTRDEILSLRLPDLLDSSEWERLDAAIQNFADGRIRREEWLFRRKDGSTFTGELVGGQLPDGRYQSIVRDISERLSRDAHEQTLKREATHRTKNILSLVQAIARQTAKHSAEHFVETFEERVIALSASHDLFIRNEWSPISIEALIRAQLASFLSPEKGALSFAGPAVDLSPEAAQSIGMALHELATNAAKYGAFSSANGQVQIDWMLGSEPDTLFMLSWRETGGPPVEAPQRKGFGTKLIAQMIERALGAKTELAFEPEGIAWTMTCPAEALRRA